MKKTKESLVQAIAEITSLKKELSKLKETEESSDREAPYSEYKEIDSGEAVHIFDRQILVKAIGTSSESATFQMTLPDGKVAVWDRMDVGSRKMLEFEGYTYFVDLMKADRHDATISIVGAGRQEEP